MINDQEAIQVATSENGEEPSNIDAPVETQAPNEIDDSSQFENYSEE